MSRQHQVDTSVIDAILRLIGGVFFAQCDASPNHAAEAIKSLRRFGDINFDNRECFALCHSLADAQEDAMRIRGRDFQKMEVAGTA
jgi:hypothetical protein